MTLKAILHACAAVPLAALATGLTSGCSYDLDPNGIDETDVSAGMTGTSVELIRFSTLCAEEEPRGLIVEVDDGIEFPGELVQSLKRSCPADSNPAVEVHVDNHYVLFDFSNAEPGRYADAAFNGYILDIVRTESAPFIVAAGVDPRNSTMEIDNTRLENDHDRLWINFQGLSIDDDSLVRVALLLGPASHSAVATPP